jgi:hypothetical protein
MELSEELKKIEDTGNELDVTKALAKAMVTMADKLDKVVNYLAETTTTGGIE